MVTQQAKPRMSTGERTLACIRRTCTLCPVALVRERSIGEIVKPVDTSKRLRLRTLPRSCVETVQSGGTQSRPRVQVEAIWCEERESHRLLTSTE